MKNEFDKTDIAALVDKFLTASAPDLSEDFTSRVMDAVRQSSNSDALSDATTDRLLSKLVNFPSITDSVLQKTRESTRYGVRAIISTSIATAISICAALAVMSATTTSSNQKRLVYTDSAFAEMSRIDEEIDKISLLVLQEEMLDLFQYRGK